MKKVLLVDDHAVVRYGVRLLLEAEADYTVCGEAENGRDAIRMARLFVPDLIVLDLNLPDMSGFEATRVIASTLPQVRILGFTFDATAEDKCILEQNGAHGCVLKGGELAVILEGLNALARGETYFPANVVKTPRAKSPPAAPVDRGLLTKLTKRELEVATLLASGRSNKEAASDLGISVKTAETHRARIMKKLGLRCFAELVHLAMTTGLIEL